ncbi:Gamma-aminobutyric acid receptor subunit beta-like [Portunus trituberculatus]|uniref:Gamma-aminobutyric acid receptor subunit beta-like n=1 Tax=Portunus trituberculatus TaxID=210409 RepID=A0A5B7FQH3_PORTR|nr:Gamma-aminobutyric acid receptor subunit beta-like [Portunus trituberculatus]
MQDHKFPPSFRINRNYSFPTRSSVHTPRAPNRKRVISSIKKGASAIKGAIPTIKDVNIIDKYSRCTGASMCSRGEEGVVKAWICPAPSSTPLLLTPTHQGISAGGLRSLLYSSTRSARRVPAGVFPMSRRLVSYGQELLL